MFYERVWIFCCYFVGNGDLLKDFKKRYDMVMCVCQGVYVGGVSMGGKG